MNPRCFSTEILQEIEIGAAAVIEGDQLSIYDRSLRQVGRRVHVIGELSIQRFSSSRKQSHASSRLDRKGSITIKFDLFCCDDFDRRSSQAKSCRKTPHNLKRASRLILVLALVFIAFAAQ